jgi:CheY-like chemotaxis protein/signal transduction histidine kinase
MYLLQSPTTSGVTAEGKPHAVQFYENDDFLYRTVIRFINSGLNKGHALVVIARAVLLGVIKQQILDIDLKTAEIKGQLVLCDADQILAQVMTDVLPDAENFCSLIKPLIETAKEKYSRVQVFDEMTNILVGQEKFTAAVKLEKHWNDLASKNAFLLLCGHAMAHFKDEAHASVHQAICAAHNEVRPTEKILNLYDRDAQCREIVFLQQQASALQTEIARRKESEEAILRALQERDDALRQERKRAREIERQRQVLITYIDYIGDGVRNPVAGVHGSNEFIKDGIRRMEEILENPALAFRKKKEALLHALAAMKNDTAAITGHVVEQRELLNEIAVLAELEAKQIRIQMSSFALKEAVQSWVEGFADKLANKDLKPVLKLPEQNVFIKTDRSHFEEIFKHCLLSCIQLADKSDVVIALVSEQNDSANCLRVTFDSRGRKVSQEAIEQLSASPLTQPNRKLPKEKNDIGLGLSISKKLLALHAGEMTIKKLSNQGIRVSFTMGCQIFSAEELSADDKIFDPVTGVAMISLVGEMPINENAEGMSQETVEPGASEPPSILSGSTITSPQSALSGSIITSPTEGAPQDQEPIAILVVDDHPSNQKIVQQFFRAQGINSTFTMASNGQEAIEQWRKGKFSLICMDVKMPVMDGLEATRAIRAEEQRQGYKRHIPIVGVSANSRSEQIAEAKEAGMDGYVTKPCGREEFFAEIKRVLPSLTMPVRRSQSRAAGLPQAALFSKHLIDVTGPEEKAVASEASRLQNG